MKNTLFIICAFISQIYAQSMIHKELLGKPTDSSMSIKVFFDDSVDICCQFGTTMNTYTGQTPWQTFSANTPAEVLMSGLQANTKYFYRVNYRQPGSTNIQFRPEFSFQTAKTTGNSFSFVIQADPHLDSSSDTALYRRCLNNQLLDNPDFLIDLGDIMMTDKLKNASNVVPHDTVPYRCKLLRSYYETVTHSVPLFITLGNHEGILNLIL